MPVRIELHMDNGACTSLPPASACDATVAKSADLVSTLDLLADFHRYLLEMAEHGVAVKRVSDSDRIPAGLRIRTVVRDDDAVRRRNYVLAERAGEINARVRYQP